MGIYNADDNFISKALKDFKGKTLTFGTNSYASYGNYDVSESGTMFEIKIDKAEYKIKIARQALPSVYQELFAAVLLCANQLGIDLNTACESINKNFSLPKSRSSIFRGKKNSLIVDSSYNSSKTAVIAFLDLLKHLSDKEKGEAVFLMGDMRELGEEAEREHNEVAKKINESVDILYCVGPLTQKFILPKINPRIKTFWYKNSKEAGAKLLEDLNEKSIVLVKGSQNSIYLEEAVKMLLKDPDDVKMLCRQTSYWTRVKSAFFQNSL